MGSRQTQESITLRVDQKEAQEVLVKEECSRQDPFIKASQASKMMSIFNAEIEKNPYEKQQEKYN